jgi:hypothetical protein
VEDPGDLILKDGAWKKDGPLLPIELSHVTSRRTLALALCRGAAPVRTLWTYMGTDAVGEAVWSLSQREGSKPENVGFLDLETGEYWCRTVDEHLPTISDWALGKNEGGENIGTVIWSDLKPNFEKKTRKELSADNVISYLKGLRPEMKDRAREYLEKAPAQAQTEITAAIRTAWDSIW